MVRCSDKSIYTGFTNNLDLRIKQHKLGVYPKCYTFKRRPIELIWTQEVFTYEEAQRLEVKLKKWSRAKKLALAKGDWEEVPRLAANKEKTRIIQKSDYPEPSEGRLVEG